jgi:DNA adenine methylase
VPVTATASFVGYTKEGFDEDMQFRLRELCDRLDAKGVMWMLSNSHVDYIHDLYKRYKIKEVSASRNINCKAESRGKIKEVIITNY